MSFDLTKMISKMLKEKDISRIKKEFVDRKSTLRLLNEFLNKVKSERRNQISLIIGIGGVGKTWLIKRFLLDVDNAIKVYIDMGDKKSFPTPRYVMLRIYNELKKSKINMEIFEFLFSFYMQMMEGSKGIERIEKQIPRELIMFLRLIPGIAYFVSVADFITSMGRKIHSFLKKRYSSVVSWLKDTLGDEFLKKLVEIIWEDPRKFMFILIDALREDIVKNKLETPIILVFDRFEYITQEAKEQISRGGYIEVGNLKLTNEDIWLYASLKIPNCLSIFSSRELPIWATKKKADFNLIKLTVIDSDAAAEYIRKRGISNESLIKRIIDITSGHPLLIALIVDYILTLMEEHGSEIAFELIEFKSRNLEDLYCEVLNRLESHLSDRIKNLIRLAAIPRFFDFDILAMAVDYPLSISDYVELTNISFIVPKPEIETSVRSVHDFARKVILSGMLKSSFKKYCEKLIKAFKKKYEETKKIEYLAEYVYLKTQLDEDSAGDELEKLFWSRFKKAKFDESEMLLDAYIPKKLINKIRKNAMISRIAIKFGRYMRIIADLSDAEKYNPKNIEEFRICGRALLNLGRAYKMLRILDTAIIIFNKSIKILSSCSDLNHDCMRNLGHSEIEIGEIFWMLARLEDSLNAFKNAEKHYEKAIEMTNSRDHNMWRNRGRARIRIAETLIAMGREEEALNTLSLAKEDTIKSLKLSNWNDMLSFANLARISLREYELGYAEESDIFNYLSMAENIMEKPDRQILIIKANAYILLNRLDDTEKVVKKIVEISDGSDAVAWILYGVLEYRKGNKEKMLEHLSKANMVSNGSDPIANAILESKLDNLILEGTLIKKLMNV